MNEAMTLQDTLQSKRRPTVMTSVRFDSTVYETMDFQIALLSKRFLTVIASMRLDSTMDELMNFQTVQFSNVFPQSIHLYDFTPICIRR